MSSRSQINMPETFIISQNFSVSHQSEEVEGGKAGKPSRDQMVNTSINIQEGVYAIATTAKQSSWKNTQTNIHPCSFILSLLARNMPHQNAMRCRSQAISSSLHSSVPPCILPYTSFPAITSARTKISDAKKPPTSREDNLPPHNPTPPPPSHYPAHPPDSPPAPHSHS